MFPSLTLWQFPRKTLQIVKLTAWLKFILSFFTVFFIIAYPYCWNALSFRTSEHAQRTHNSWRISSCKQNQYIGKVYSIFANRLGKIVFCCGDRVICDRLIRFGIWRGLIAISRWHFQIFPRASGCRQHIPIRSLVLISC